MDRDEYGRQPCRRGIWCASSEIVYDADDGKGRRVPSYGPRAFCDRDAPLVGHALGELPGQYAHLHAELGNPATRTQSVRVPFGPRIPLRVDVDALMRLITTTVVAWHERVAVAARLSFPEGRLAEQRRPGRAVQRAVDVMAERVPVLLALPPEPMVRVIDLRDLADLPDDTPGVVHAVFAEVVYDLDGGDAGMEILQLRYLCRAVLGETRAKAETFDGIPCHECETMALEYAEPPSDPSDPAPRSRCASCGATMSDGEFAAWTDRYGKWAESANLPSCRRCQRGDHSKCAWTVCPCRHTVQHAA